MIDPKKELEEALEQLVEASRIASDRLRAIWNPETRRYEPREEMVALHDIINQNLRVYNRIRAAMREIPE